LFRLDKVLAFKERLEREARVELAEAESRLADLELRAHELRRERGDLPDCAGDPEDLARWAQYGEALRRKECSVRERARAFLPRVEERRLAHRGLRQEVEGLRKLKEREDRRRRTRRERQAQEHLDDAAGRPFVPGAGSFFPPPALEIQSSRGTAERRDGPDPEDRGVSL
jgi:flagellar export protein FliJ